MQLSAVNRIFAVRCDSAVCHVGDFLAACVNTCFGYAGPACDGQTVGIQFAVACGNAVDGQILFQAYGNGAVRAHLGLDIVAVVIAKRTGAGAFNGQGFIGLDGFVVGGDAGSVAVGGDFEACISRIGVVIGSLNRFVDGVFAGTADIGHGQIAIGIHRRVAAKDVFGGIADVADFLLGEIQLAAVNRIGAGFVDTTGGNVGYGAFQAAVANADG